MSNQDATRLARRERIESGIYRRPDGNLEIGFRDAEGRQRWRKVDGGLKAARAQLATEHASRARGERIAADPRLKFTDAAQAWWDTRVVKLRPGTQNAYGAGLAHLRKPQHFGRMRLVDVTPTDVARYVTAQQAAGLKGWTIKGHLTVLSSVFTYAARHLGFAGTNPVSLLDRVERPSSDDEKEKRILTAEELARLLDAIDEPYRLLFAFAAETGARLSEALGVAWDDLDLEAETVTFTYQLDRKRKRQPLKTKRSRRCIEITPQLAARLREHKLASAYSQPHQLVFTSLTGTGLDQRNVGGRVLARAVKTAGLEEVTGDQGEVLVPAPTFHALRHTHASALIAQGWDVQEVSSRLGHSSVTITLQEYAHEFDAVRRSTERRGRLEALYGGPNDGSAMEAQARSNPQQTQDGMPENVRELRPAGGTAR